jgi:hypothetical protein
VLGGRPESSDNVLIGALGAERAVACAQLGCRHGSGELPVYLAALGSCRLCVEGSCQHGMSEPDTLVLDLHQASLNRGLHRNAVEAGYGQLRLCERRGLEQSPSSGPGESGQARRDEVGEALGYGKGIAGGSVAGAGDRARELESVERVAPRDLVNMTDERRREGRLEPLGEKPVE